MASAVSPSSIVALATSHLVSSTTINTLLSYHPSSRGSTATSVYSGDGSKHKVALWTPLNKVVLVKSASITSQIAFSGLTLGTNHCNATATLLDAHSSSVGAADVDEAVGAEVGGMVVGEAVGEALVGEDVGALVGEAVEGEGVGAFVGVAVVGDAVGEVVVGAVLTIVTITFVALIVPNKANVEDAANTLLASLDKVAANVTDEPADTVDESKMTVDATCTLPADIELITTALVCTPAANATVAVKSKRKDASKMGSSNKAMSIPENDTVAETVSYEERVGATVGEGVGIGMALGEGVVG